MQYGISLFICIQAVCAREPASQPQEDGYQMQDDGRFKGRFVRKCLPGSKSTECLDQEYEGEMRDLIYLIAS